MFLAGVDTFWGKKEVDDKPSKPAKTRPSKPATTKPPTPGDEDKVWPCGLCGSPIDVTLHVENTLKEPFFNESIFLEGLNQRQLFHFLHEAANQNKIFRFSMTHYGAELGFMIDSINGLKSEWVNGKLNYWRILYINGTALEFGVSTFIPEDKDEFIFRSPSSKMKKS
ncbi:hypothetical protein C0Q70_10091 [Pomacea canaliculata]|uniref:Uncharacterized protein n=1 Tax=Pomacea canaliculata TaxID=400727 RepID=A0A2T7PBM6_POMCA|nr:hypothetical protein C0Q70_10091 [Pomacea canaliculata]